MKLQVVQLVGLEALSVFKIKTNSPVLAELSKMKQKSNTKKSLGRVWFRYFQLYSMTGKLTAACVNIG